MLRRPGAGRLIRSYGGRRFGLASALALLLSVSLAPSRLDAARLGRHAGSIQLPPVGVPMPKAAKAKYLVLMVLDGARPDYFGVTRLPHIDALRAHGTQYVNTIDGILESETPAGHTTISTGSTPRRDGILGFSWAQNDHDFSLFSPTVVRSGTMEHIMESAHVPTLAGLYKARFPHALVVALSGHKYYAADPLGGPQADAIMYFRGTLNHHYAPTAIPGHVPPAGVLEDPQLNIPSEHLPTGQDDHLATLLALSAFAHMHQRLTLINYPEFDWPLGHVDGGIDDHTGVVALMKTLDHDLGMIEYAYRRAGVLNQTLFVITADHGMVPIKHFVPDSIVRNAIAAAGTQAPSMSFNTGAYVWLHDPAKARAVARGIVAAHDPGIQSVYYLTFSRTGPRYQRAPGEPLGAQTNAANSYLLRTLLNGKEPSVVALCREHASFANPSTKWKADHGGATWQSQHIPLILSGPGIQPGLVIRSAAQLEDVAPTVLADMGVAPTGMEGHVLTDGLLQPPAEDEAARQAEVARVNPVVGGLMDGER